MKNITESLPLYLSIEEQTKGKRVSNDISYKMIKIHVIKETQQLGRSKSLTDAGPNKSMPALNILVKHGSVLHIVTPFAVLNTLIVNRPLSQWGREGNHALYFLNHF